LFWLEGISDEYLERIYSAATCLIVSSEGEGFGLPLVEAARHKLPILARDIPVFREVAGEHAAYFRGVEPEDIVECITRWLKLYAEGRYPRSDGMRCGTWAESARRMVEFMTKNNAHAPRKNLEKAAEMTGPESASHCGGRNLTRKERAGAFYSREEKGRLFSRLSQKLIFGLRRRLRKGRTVLEVSSSGRFVGESQL
jgi:hypothetical protein